MTTMAQAVILTLVTLLFSSPVVSQPYSFVTDPSSLSQPIYAIGHAGTNVSLYCLVFNEGAGQNGEQIRTAWQSKRANDSVYDVVSFNPTGISMGPVYLVGRMEVTGLPLAGGTFRTNFTLINFTSEFNLISFKCGQLNEETIQFTLGLPSKTNSNLMHIIIM